MSDATDFYGLGGGVVRVDWTQPDLREKLGPALVHRLIPASEPALILRASSGGMLSSNGKQGGLIAEEDASGGLMVRDTVHGLAHRLDATGTRAEFTCGPAESLPGHELAAPFRLILQLWLRRRGVQMLHAAAVGLPGRGAVLLAARSGGGKSNTTMACLESGLQLLGEDYVAVDNCNPPRVWSLYAAAKLLSCDLSRFPHLSAVPRPDADGKALFQLGHLPGRWTESLPLRAILFLHISGRPESRIVPAAPGEAVKAMLTSLLMVLPAARRPLFEFTARLAKQVPVHRLELGRQPREIAAAIQNFMETRMNES